MKENSQQRGPAGFWLWTTMRRIGTFCPDACSGTGHTVLQAEDGATALALVEKEALDLILLDLMMPGIQATQAQSAIPRYPRHHDLGAERTRLDRPLHIHEH